jgi:Raf kinase inhibitor-like YbhB/YbcL family protein
MSLIITSSAFAHQGEIPRQYTCQGQDISPPLAWSGVPEAAQSLVLIVDDPDAPDPKAPRTVWCHWLLYNLPPQSSGLAEAVADTALPADTLQGKNDWHRSGYGGPCPPIGKHRYFFKLYALDSMLQELHKPGKQRLEQAIQGHIIAEAELVGLYEQR